MKFGIERLISSQLRINMVSGALSSIVSMVALAVGYPVYLHFLGYEQYGVWLVLTTVLTFAQLGNLGVDTAVVKLVAEEHGRGDNLGVQRYITTAFLFLCISGTVVLAVILAFRRQIIALFALDRQNEQTALWLLPYVALLSIYVLVVQVFEAALSGLGRMDLASYRGVLSRVTNLCVSSGLLYLGVGLPSLLIGRTVAEMVTHLAVFLCIRRMTHLRILQMPRLDLHRCKRLLGIGGTMLGRSLLTMLFSPLNKLILSRYLGVASIPVYEMAFMGSMQVKSLVGAGHVALIPEVSRISAEMTPQARARILRLYRRSLELIFLLAAPAYVVLAILAPTILQLWLGDRFIDTLPGTFRILLIGTFASVLGDPAYHTLVGTGHVHHSLTASIIQAVTNLAVVLCVLVAFPLTLAAVAWSSAIGMAAGAVFLIQKNRCVLRGLAIS